MSKKFYVSDSQFILNYNKAYPRKRRQLLESDTFCQFMSAYVATLEKTNRSLYAFLTRDHQESVVEAAKHFIHFLRKLSVFNMDEIDGEARYTDYPDLVLEVIEGANKYWRSHTRFGFMRSDFTDAFGVNTLVSMDSNLNDLILRTYRLFEERVMGRHNQVYRQAQAGTNACFSIHKRLAAYPEGYEVLQDIPVIDTVMLRTPMILHPGSSKRTGVINEIKVNPITYFKKEEDKWFCFPCKVGDLLCMLYFSVDYMPLALSLANLFELANKEESQAKPDLICIVGNPDGLNETQFYHDQVNDIWVGCISDHPRMHYFGYLKKMCLTLHNLKKMHQGWLPIHGAFVKVVMQDGSSKNIMLMGDSGAGKSESIEALRAVAGESIRDVQVIFDDMGTIHIEDGKPFGQGTEIGAFIRLDDLEPGTPYRDMDRSVFMSPENSNSRMITPASPYQFVVSNHEIDLFAYANNYTDAYGLKALSVEEVEATCKQGRRMALGTTQEVGISTTYFANPFGPMQQQEVCEPLIRSVFQCLKDNGIFVGEIYTHLGFSRENREGLNTAAKELLAFIQKGDEA